MGLVGCYLINTGRLLSQEKSQEGLAILTELTSWMVFKDPFSFTTNFGIVKHIKME